MPYEMRHVVDFTRDSKRQIQSLRNSLNEIEKRRSRLGSEFMNEQRFRVQAAQVKQQISEIERSIQKLTSALDAIERLTR